MLDNRVDIIDAIKEIGRLQPNKDKILLLIKYFNQVHGFEAMTWSSYASCGDCQRAVQHFWKHIIIEWQKTL